MKVLPLAVLMCVGAIAMWAALRAKAWWLRERDARTVFPASQAAQLLNPARRLKDPPRTMVAAFGVHRGERVLELGPGPGYFTAEAARAVGSDGSIVAVDLQPAVIAALRDHLPAAMSSRVIPMVADATHLPLADGTIDRAYLVAVLGEVPAPEQALRELKRVLRQSGVVAFSETLTDPDYIREGTLRELCASAGLRFLDRHRHILSYTMRFTSQ